LVYRPTSCDSSFDSWIIHLDCNCHWFGIGFFINSSNRKVLDISLGFTGGVMIAASFWSLLAPSIEYAEMQKELGLSEYAILASSNNWLLFRRFVSYLV
jgi:zinc transporter ZupT